MRCCIDRLEDGFAFCENLDDDGILQLAVDALPPVREGDVLTFCEDEGWCVDSAATQERRERLYRKKQELLARSSPPPFVIPPKE